MTQESEAVCRDNWCIVWYGSGGLPRCFCVPSVASSVAMSGAVRPLCVRSLRVLVSRSKSVWNWVLWNKAILILDFVASYFVTHFLFLFSSLLYQCLTEATKPGPDRCSYLIFYFPKLRAKQISLKKYTAQPWVFVIVVETRLRRSSTVPKVQCSHLKSWYASLMVC